MRGVLGSLNWSWLNCEAIETAMFFNYFLPDGFQFTFQMGRVGNRSSLQFLDLTCISTDSHQSTWMQVLPAKPILGFIIS